MNLIQTTWLSNNGQPMQHGGWINERYHLMSCALSCLQLKTLHPERILKLHTDRRGQQILIDKLQLPYDQVDSSLESTKLPFPEFMWVLKKIISYTMSTADFLHLDSDVFIFNKLPSAVFNSKLTVQNEEFFVGDDTIYDETLRVIKERFDYKPAYLELDLNQPGHALRSINAGLIGGDYTFFIEYADEVFNFLDKNQSSLKYLNKNCNTFIEQYIFKMYTEKTKTPINALEPVANTSDYDGYADFHKVLFGKKYLHIMGNYKDRYWVNNQVELFLKMHHPKIHELIVKYVSSQNHFLYTASKSINETSPTLKNHSRFSISTYTLCTNFFSRSLFFVEKYVCKINIDTANYLIMKRYLKNKIKKIKQKSLRSRLIDLYNYESQIFNYVFKNSSLPNCDTKQVLSKHYFESSLENLCKVSWNKAVPVIRSKWNWSDSSVNNLIEKPSNTFFDYNFVQPVATTCVALYSDHTNRIVFEYKLDLTSSFLVELLELPITIQAVLECFFAQYQDCGEAEKALIKDIVLTKLSFFYLSNFLKVHL